MHIEDLLKAKREEILKIAAKHGARKIRIFGRTRDGAAYISLDYMKQEGQIYRIAGADAAESSLIKKLLAGRNATVVSEFAGKKIVREPVPITKEEPLKLELQDFIDCIEAHHAPRVTGEAAKRALELAFEIMRQIRQNAPASIS